MFSLVDLLSQFSFPLIDTKLTILLVYRGMLYFRAGWLGIKHRLKTRVNH